MIRALRHAGLALEKGLGRFPVAKILRDEPGEAALARLRALRRDQHVEEPRAIIPEDVGVPEVFRSILFRSLDINPYGCNQILWVRPASRRSFTPGIGKPDSKMVSAESAPPPREIISDFG